MQAELRHQALELVAELNRSFRRTNTGTALEVEAQGMQMAPETKLCWRRLFEFMNSDVLKDFREMGVPVGLA